MAEIILTAAAFLAILPAGLLLFLLLDRYAAPKVTVSVFEEYKVLVAFIVGIPAGLPLAVIFLVYADSLGNYDALGAFIYLFLFVAVASLGRIIFLRFRTFSGEDRRGAKTPFYALAFGCGTAVSVMLAAGNLALSLGTAAETVALVGVLSCDMALLEGWAGLRFSSAHVKRGSVFPVLLVEGLALFAVSPLYFQLPYLNLAALLGLLVALGLLALRDEEAILRPLLPSPVKEGDGRPFGRVETR